MTDTAFLTPLEQIEQVVQQRAKDSSLDMAREDTHNVLAQLVGEEIRSWNNDHIRGLRPFPIDDPDGVSERAMRNLTGYGPLAPLLDDDDVWEIMINAPDGTFVLYSYTSPGERLVGFARGSNIERIRESEGHDVARRHTPDIVGHVWSALWP